MHMRLDTIEVVTLFVENIDETKAFYQKVFAPEIVYQDEVSSVLKFSGAMINLLKATEAPELVEPSAVAAPGSGARVLLTIKVAVECEDDPKPACVVETLLLLVP